MSYIGEHRAFLREADRIRHRLATEELSGEERTRLVREAKEADVASEAAWELARADNCADEADRADNNKGDYNG
jgi:hypothetical protein